MTNTQTTNECSSQSSGKPWIECIGVFLPSEIAAALAKEKIDSLDDSGRAAEEVRIARELLATFPHGPINVQVNTWLDDNRDLLLSCMGGK